MANRNTTPLLTRFLAKVNKNGPIPQRRPELGQCWVWTGSTVNGKYGKLLGANRKVVLAHRCSYELFVKPIPDGLEVDHLCRNRLCVNPMHLEPVTCLVNHQRIFTGQCKRGHDLSGDNLYVGPNGYPNCRACRRIRRSSRREVERVAARKYYAENKESLKEKRSQKRDQKNAQARERYRLRGRKDRLRPRSDIPPGK